MLAGIATVYSVIAVRVQLHLQLYSKLNQMCIRDSLMSHTEYVPIVNTKGDVIGKTPAIEAVNYKNAYGTDKNGREQMRICCV